MILNDVRAASSNVVKTCKTTIKEIWARGLEDSTMDRRRGKRNRERYVMREREREIERGREGERERERERET